MTQLVHLLHSHYSRINIQVHLLQIIQNLALFYHFIQNQIHHFNLQNSNLLNHFKYNYYLRYAFEID